MNKSGLSEAELALIVGALKTFPGIDHAILYGSRAKGTHRPESDIDIALTGIDDGVEVQAVAEALEDLPLPYQFDLRPLSGIKHTPLREHIDRVGIPIYTRTGLSSNRES